VRCGELLNSLGLGDCFPLLVLLTSLGLGDCFPLLVLLTSLGLGDCFPLLELLTSLGLGDCSPLLVLPGISAPLQHEWISSGAVWLQGSRRQQS
jgi:hypothetical protein